MDIPQDTVSSACFTLVLYSIVTPACSAEPPVTYVNGRNRPSLNTPFTSRSPHLHPGSLSLTIISANLVGKILTMI